MLDFRLVKISLRLFKIGVSWTTFIRKWDLNVRTVFTGVKPEHVSSTILHKCGFSSPIFTSVLRAYKVVLKTQLAEFFFFFSLGIKRKKQPLQCSPSCDCEIWGFLFSGDLTDGAKCNISQRDVLLSSSFFCFCIFLGNIVQKMLNALNASLQNIFFSLEFA